MLPKNENPWVFAALKYFIYFIFLFISLFFFLCNLWSFKLLLSLLVYEIKHASNYWSFMQSEKDHKSFISTMMPFNGIFSYMDLPELEIYNDYF